LLQRRPNDLLSIFVNMEHSFLGDLGMTITCPNGTEVSLLDWPNGGGGTFLGEALDDNSQLPGVGYDYFWDPCATNGTMGENAAGNQILPSGTYEASENLCAFVGCPLNGQWTIEVTDNLAIDNGYIFSWGINFNPALIPGLTTFTPTIGAGADSSYWSGPFIASSDAGMDVITLDVTQAGSYEYIYHVVNSFGCANDTTVVVDVEIPPLVSAGEDLLFSCDPVVLEGGFLALPTPLCGQATGAYQYCYNNNQNYVVTYCPDNPGDGFSAIEISFLQGSVETFFDEFYVYDGNTTSAPLLAGYAWPLYGSLAGLTFTATNPGGCLTIQVTPDGSISCGDGFFPAWNYEVSCASPVDYIWSWTPAAGLADPDSPVTALNSLIANTVFTLTGYPVGFPECAVSDDVTVSVATDLEVQVANLYEVCPGEPVTIAAPAVSGGTPPYDIQWADANGQPIAGTAITIPEAVEATYCVTVTDQCDIEQEECVLVSIYPEVPATFTVSPGFGCDPLTATLLSDYTDYNELQQMVWDFGDSTSATTMGSASHTYTEEGEYFPSLFILTDDGCEFSYTAENAIQVWPTPLASFAVEPEFQILPNTTFQFTNQTINATTYEWNFGALGTSEAQDTSFTFPAETPAIYYVQLNAYSAFGCSDSTVRQVIVREDIDVYIPNTFTPNGDGINDSWMISGRGFRLEGFTMEVYNRWGDIVFRTDDPLHAWTGNHQNGEYFVPDGVYQYRCRVRDVQNDINHLYEGHVLIIR
jgi:gliding motility-associated-like protein